MAKNNGQFVEWDFGQAEDTNRPDLGRSGR